MGTNKKAFHLRWDNHMESIRSLFERSFYDQALTDVTISCPDGKLRGHKLILSACSPYFESVFKENPCKHPVLIFKEVKHREMSLLLEYMYRGEVDVLDSELQTLIQTASDLQVRGLAYGFQTETTVASKSQTSDKSEVETEQLMPTKMSDMTRVATPKSRSLTITKVIPEDAATAVESEENHTPRSLKRPAVGSAESAPRIKLGPRVSPQFTATSSHKTLESTVLQIPKSSPDPKTSPSLSSNGIDYSLSSNNVSISNGVSNTEQNGGVKAEDAGIVVLRGRPENLTKVPSNDPNTNSAVNDTVDSEDDENMGGELRINIKEEAEDDDEEEEETLGYLCESSFTEGEATNGLLGKSDGSEDNDAKETLSTVCPFCFMDFKTPDVLRKHVQMHTANPRPHQCEVCKLSFGRSSHLERHRRTHTGERPFACPIVSCGKRFARQDKVKQHVGRHHNAESRLPKQRAPRMNKPRPPQALTPGKRPRGRPRKYPDAYPESYTEVFPEAFMVGHQMTEEPLADRGISSNSIAAADMLLQLSSNGSHSQAQPTDFSSRGTLNSVTTTAIMSADGIKPQ